MLSLSIHTSFTITVSPLKGNWDIWEGVCSCFYKTESFIFIGEHALWTGNFTHPVFLYFYTSIIWNICSSCRNFIPSRQCRITSFNSIPSILTPSFITSREHTSFWFPNSAQAEFGGFGLRRLAGQVFLGAKAGRFDF